ncbi:MAG: hypothetical protein AVDCRST_MAG48-532, partial [uncultured Friedmanniella sp.]
GDQHRQRDGDRRDHGGADREQEREDHQHGEGEAEPALDGEVVDRLLDGGGLVEDGAEGGAGAHRALQVGQQVLEGVGDLDGVGVALLEHGQAESGPPVLARDRRRLDRRHRDGGQRPQRDGAVGGGDRPAADGLRRAGRAADLDGQLGVLVV